MCEKPTVSKEQVLRVIREQKTINAQKIAHFLGIGFEVAVEALKLITNAELSMVLDTCPNCNRFKTTEHNTFQFGKNTSYGTNVLVCTDLNEDTRVTYVNENIAGVPLRPNRVLADQKKPQKSKF